MSEKRERQMARVLHGVEQSRRVGWARFYEETEAREAEKAVLVDVIVGWMAEATALAVQIQHHNRLPSDDPLVEWATDLINRVGATPTGRRIVEAVT